MDVFEQFTSHPLAVRLGWSLLHSVWQGAVVAFVLGLALFFLRKRSPDARYTVSCMALAAMVVLPVATFWAASTSTPTAGGIQLAAIPGSPSVAVQNTPARDDVAGETAASSQPASASATAFSIGSRLSGFFEPALPWLSLGWFMGVMAFSLRLLGAWIQSTRLRHRRVTPVGEAWVDSLKRIAHGLGVRRRVLLLQSALIDAPLLIGWMRPVILLPMSAIIGLSQDQLEAILAHELAHVRRYDYLARLLQSFAETLLFYHPAVWWISRQITIEREYCCDDAAVEACGDKLSYAKALTGLEQLRGPTPQLSLAARGGSLFDRIRRLLGVPAHGRPETTRGLGGIVTFAAVLAFSVGALLPVLAVAITAAETPVSEPVLEQATASGSDHAGPSTKPPPAETGVAEGPPDAALSQDALQPAISAPAASRIGVALIEFTRVGLVAEGGEASAQMYELVGERLANAPAIRFVDRDKLNKAIAELKLSQTGLVDPATATQLGRIIGARIFVAGKLMKLGDDYVVTVRLIDTQTTEVSALRVTAPESDGFLELADRTADQVIQRLAKTAAGKAGAVKPSPLADAIETLRIQLAGRELPTLAVRVPESHIGTWVPDPAGENEMINVLTQVGFRVVDISTMMKREPASWWLTLFRGPDSEEEGQEFRLTNGWRSTADIMHDKRIVKIRDKVDMFVIGEAFSEYAGETHGFESCKARVEIKAVDTKTDAIAAAISHHAAGADIAELIAGKKALRAAGGQAGLQLARRLAVYWETANATQTETE